MGTRWGPRDPISRQRRYTRWQARPNGSLPEPVAAHAGCAAALAWIVVFVVAVVLSLPAPEPVAAGGWQRVRATWYGGPDGLLGNRTACGQVLTTSLWGVAHGSLRCYTKLQLRRNGHVITVPVLDRSGGGLDLMPAVKRALGCGDICWLDMRIGGGVVTVPPAPPPRAGRTLPPTDTAP